MNYEIQDHAGISYDVEIDIIDSCIRFLLRKRPHAGPLVGHANLWDYGTGEMELREIVIEARVFERNPNPFTRLFRPGSWIDYRERKLGQALLDCVTTYARIQGCTRMTIGQVRAFANNRLDLEAWYGRNGFKRGDDGRLQKWLE